MRRYIAAVILGVALAIGVPIAQAAPELPCRRVIRAQVKAYPGGGLVPAYQRRAGHPSTAVGTQDTALTGWEVKIGPGVQQVLTEVGQDPLAAYRWVRDNVEYLPYFGAKNGAEGTAWSRIGNDFDQAALLAALLRSQGYPVRFVYGVVRVEAKMIADWCGMSTAEKAVELLIQGGVPVNSIEVSGIVKYVEMSHCWLEAKVPYTSPGYQGAGEPVWIPLDPSYKKHTIPGENLDLFGDLGFQEENFLLDYLQTEEDLSPEGYFRELLRGKLTDYGNRNSLRDAAFQLSIVPSNAGALPTGLPQELSVLGVIWEEPVIPAVYHHRLRMTLWDGLDDSLGVRTGDVQVTIPTAFFSLHALSVLYEPATDEDKALAETSPSGAPLDATIRYQIKMRPKLLADGKPIGEFFTGYFLEAGIPTMEGIPGNIGKEQTLLVETLLPATDPADSQPGSRRGVVEEKLKVGGAYALGCTGGMVTAGRMQAGAEELRRLQTEGTTQEVLAGTLTLASQQYLHKTTLAAQSFAAFVGVRHIEEPTIMLCGVHPTANLDTAGVFFDVHQYMLAFVSRTDMARWDRTRPLRERAFMFLVGMQSSYNEHKVLADVFQTTAVSSVRILKHERSLGYEPLILDGDSSNLTTTLQGLPLTQEQREEILNRVMGQSFKLIIPTKSTSLEGWNGWGYILWDPNTGAGGYYISGGVAGGNTSGLMPYYVVAMLNYQEGRYAIFSFAWVDETGRRHWEMVFLWTSEPTVLMTYISPDGYPLPEDIVLNGSGEQNWSALPETYILQHDTKMRVGGLCWRPAEPNILRNQYLEKGTNGDITINRILWSTDYRNWAENNVYQYAVSSGNIHLSVRVEQGLKDGTVNKLTEGVNIFEPIIYDETGMPLLASGDNAIYVAYDNLKNYLVNKDCSVEILHENQVVGHEPGEIGDPGEYTIRYSCGDKVIRQIDLIVVKIDLGIDTDNNGLIDAADDRFEDVKPGCVMPIDLKGDSGETDEVQRIVVTVTPLRALAQVSIEAGKGLCVYSDSGKKELLVDEEKESVVGVTDNRVEMYVDGISIGDSYVTAKYRVGREVIYDDRVRIYVTQTPSRTPTNGGIGYTWEIPVNNESDYTADHFVEVLQRYGYNIRRFKDNRIDDGDPGNCIMRNFLLLKDASALYISTDGDDLTKDRISVMEMEEETQIREWAKGYDFIEVVPAGYLHHAKVRSSWFRDNWSVSLGHNNALVIWGVCFSENDDPSSSVAKSAGGRWRVGFRGYTNNPETDGVVQTFLDRLTSAYRTTFAAYGPENERSTIWGSATSENLSMSGNPWTTLCPSIPIGGYYPNLNTNANDNEGIGAIVFDSYMKDTSPELALKSDGCNEITQSHWGADRNGRYFLRFHYRTNPVCGEGYLEASGGQCQSEDEDVGRYLDGDITKTGNGESFRWRY